PICIKWGLEAEPGHEDVADLLGLKKRLSYLDGRCITWMKEQFELCQKHQHQSTESNFLPKRLLQVHGEEIRLVSREDVRSSVNGDVPKYAALSYCWGSPEDSTMSLIERRLGISHQMLPPALQDAVTMARALSLPFLWVDALCIFQGNPTDWEGQCVEMHKIYGNAFVTFCAAASGSCREGLLERSCHEISIPFHCADDSIHVSGYYRLRVKEIDSNGTLSEFTRNADVMARNAWISRGWVFQERVSSTRKLVFGRRDIHFLCAHRERAMGDAEGRFERLDNKLPPTRDFQLYRPGSEIASAREILNEWLSLIRAYGSLQFESFTYPGDILPAISGLAALYLGGIEKAVGEKLDPANEYKAGYWRRDLFRSLLWSHATVNSGPTHRLEYLQYLAHRPHLPSWNHIARSPNTNFWVLADSEWPQLLNRYEPEVELLEAHTTTTGDNPFGAVEGNACLQLKTYVMDLAILERDEHLVPQVGLVGTDFYLVYKSERFCKVTMDFRSGGWPFMHGQQDTRKEQAEEFYTDVKSFQLALLGRFVDTQDIFSERPRRSDGTPAPFMGPVGVVLHRVPCSDGLYRVGAFGPDLKAESDEGLLRFKSMSEVKTVCIR
ncbi:heterokaryon incompatibility protein-domain-containing protein, partial [Cladorrhinum sp. PSN332]